VIARDRGAGYRKAATKGAPHAQQVLDRWHLLKNLGEVIQKTLAQQIDVLRQAGQQVKKTPQQTSLAPPESAHFDGRRRKPPRRKPPAPSPRRAWQMAMHKPGARACRERRKPRRTSSGVCICIRTPCANTCRCQRLWHTTAIPIPLLSNPTGPIWKSEGLKVR